MASPEYISPISRAKWMAAHYLTDLTCVEMSVEEVAAKVGVTCDTLYSWRQTLEFEQQVAVVRKTYFDNHRKWVDVELFKKTKEGHLQALKLFYDLGGYFHQKYPEEIVGGAGYRVIIEPVQPKSDEGGPHQDPPDGQSIK
jgi:hypothetical protein